jgi:translocation and assembly module TamB
VARAYSVARADSARLDREMEIERMVTGRAPPALQVTLPRSIRSDEVSGSAFAAGTVTGNIRRFDLRGRAGGEDVVLRGSYARSVRSEYVWTNAPSADGRLAVGVQGEHILAMGFSFDTVDARVAYRNRGGHAELLVRRGTDQDYVVAGDFQLSPERNEVRLTDLRLRLDTALWVGTRATVVSWGGPGIEVDQFEIQDRQGGRIYVDGLLPTEGQSNLVVAVDRFPVEQVTDLLQGDLELAGQLTLSARMRGTLRAPTYEGAFALLDGRLRSDTLPIVRGTFDYAARQLVTHVDVLRTTGTAIAVADARIPIDLALTGVTGDRLIDAPMQALIVADSLPLDLVPHFTGAVTRVSGRAAGRVAIGGRLRRPTLVGGIAIVDGRMTVAYGGATIDNIAGQLRFAGDSVYTEDPGLVGRSRGEVRLRGSVGIGEWRRPVLNLYLVAEDAQLLDGDRGRIRADVGLAMTGPLDNAFLSGQVTVLQGVIRAPEPTGKEVIKANDPALFQVLDTTVIADRELFPPTNPLMRNLRMDVLVDVRRGTFARTRDANVEIFTDYPLSVRIRNEALSMTGVVSTERGEYNFLSKRFEVRRGSALFIGSTDINPTLQITGEYEVVLPGAPATQIKVQIGGTLRQPRLALESDAQPPRSQSELLSLLAFGRS